MQGYQPRLPFAMNSQLQVKLFYSYVIYTHTTQAEEVEALRAIYEECFSSQSEGVYRVCVCSEGHSVEVMVGDSVPGY